MPAFEVKVGARIAQRFDSDAVATMKLVPKAYVPWSENGCSLAEARERSADRLTWNRWQEINDSSSPSSVEKSEKITLRKRLDASCLDHLKSSRLIAYGRLGTREAARQLIPSESWTALTTVDWQKLVAADGRKANFTLFDVLVFPLLFAPNRVDLLEGKSLAEVLASGVLNDVEVAALAADAIRVSPKYERVFVQGRCHVYGFEEWPLAFERWSMIGAVHPDPALRSKFDGPNPDPIEVVIAAEALIHRYCALVSILRRRELHAHGVSAELGGPGKISHAIWSHEQFHLEMASGDILQDNPAPTGRFDRLVRRWLAVVLERGIGEAVLPNSGGPVTQYREPIESELHGAKSIGRANAPNSSTLFHVEPTLPHDLRSDTTDIQQSPARSRKGIARVVTSAAARKACLEWLVGMMKANPNVRLYSIETLWAQAQAKWSKLSQRQFFAARTEAIHITGAAPWASGGAPKKSR